MKFGGNKFNAKRVQLDGYWFDSKREGQRYLQLRLMNKAGEISDLELQPAYDLMVNGRCIGKYVGDFRYRDKDNNVVLEDVKSKATRTPVYLLKKKILETYNPPVKITEVF